MLQRARGSSSPAADLQHVLNYMVQHYTLQAALQQQRQQKLNRKLQQQKKRFAAAASSVAAESSELPQQLTNGAVAFPVSYAAVTALPAPALPAPALPAADDHVTALPAPAADEQVTATLAVLPSSAPAAVEDQGTHHINHESSSLSLTTLQVRSFANKICSICLVDQMI